MQKASGGGTGAAEVDLADTSRLQRERDSLARIGLRRRKVNWFREKHGEQRKRRTACRGREKRKRNSTPTFQKETSIKATEKIEKNVARKRQKRREKNPVGKEETK